MRTSEHGSDEALLARRARALASAPAAVTTAEILEVVTVRLGAERCAVPASQVREVQRLSAFSALPGAEPPVFGLTTWRGELILLLDIRTALGMSPGTLNDLRYLLVLDAGRQAAGVMVDEVLGMESVPLADIRTARRGGQESPASELVRGVTSEATIVLDATTLTRLIT